MIASEIGSRIVNVSLDIVWDTVTLELPDLLVEVEQVLASGGARRSGFTNRPMKLHYYPETDTLYIELNARPATRKSPRLIDLDFDIDPVDVVSRIRI